MDSNLSISFKKMKIWPFYVSALQNKIREKTGIKDSNRRIRYSDWIFLFSLTDLLDLRLLIWLLQKQTVEVALLYLFEILFLNFFKFLFFWTKSASLG